MYSAASCKAAWSVAEVVVGLQKLDASQMSAQLEMFADVGGGKPARSGQ
jgi:hypothetical protein